MATRLRRGAGGVGVALPVEVNGLTQKRVDGGSLVHAFDDEDADGHHRTQYFEVLGNRALYHEGFMVSMRHCARLGRSPPGPADQRPTRWRARLSCRR